jgi:hypothetical protein
MLQITQKAQIFILDILIVLFFCISILYLEFFIVDDFITNKKNEAFVIDQYQQLIITEKIISDSNYLGKKDLLTNHTYKNQIDLSLEKINNIEKDFENICFLSLCNKIEINKDSKINRKIKRAVINNNKFCVLEVGFCE